MSDILDCNLLGLVESLICRCRRLVSRIDGLFIQHLNKFELASLLEISWLLSLVVHLSVSKTLI